METKIGKIVCGDSLDAMRGMENDSVDLVVTSPPYALVNPKMYSNPSPDEYVDWLLPFGREIFRILKDSGSLVLNMGSTWNRGKPTKSLYHYKTIIALCERCGFELAQDLIWSKMNGLGPVKYINQDRVRLKSFFEYVFWLSKTPDPKADNKNVLVPYSKSMMDTFGSGYKNKSPNGMYTDFANYVDNGGAISGDVLYLANSSSNDQYQKKCKETGAERHNARFPPLFAEFFIRFLTDEGDMVLDPFAGSCSTGEAAQATRRRWVCIEKEEKFLQGALFRFPPKYTKTVDPKGEKYIVNKVGYRFYYGQQLPF